MTLFSSFISPESSFDKFLGSLKLIKKFWFWSDIFFVFVSSRRSLSEGGFHLAVALATFPFLHRAVRMFFPVRRVLFFRRFPPPQFFGHGRILILIIP